ncbi:MAG: apolipoprotein N-acyltransferase [Rickettsiaceae bacterium H1]|nr:apolipoprotein N-acyltransferase [Rickettsiaceae bacterium H1]
MKNYLHKYDIALFCGVGITLSLAPFYFFPLLIFSLITFYFLLANRKSLKEAFFIAYWFGFAYFSTGLYWFAFPLLIDAKQFAWLIPFAIFGLPALFALYFGFSAVIFCRFRLYFKKFFPLIFAIVFTCAEWVIGHLFTGFPWNLIGYAWVFSNEVMQITSVCGIYGLIFITFLFTAVIAEQFVQKNINYFALIFAILMMIGIYAWGKYRLENNLTTYVADTKLRLVQAMIPQRMNISQKQANRILEKYLELSLRPGIEKISAVIWPEGALPFKVDNDLTNIIKSRLSNDIIFGASRFAKGEVFNSLYVNNVNLFYDKRHLVPFGEYVPFRKLLPVNRITLGVGDMSPNQDENRNIAIPGLPVFVPSICYEAIFPNEIINRKEETKAKWIINITNDAWFGKSSEQYQHLDMARIRAIEEGIPMVRVANAGINAVIDSYGRIISLLPLGEEGIIDVKLPESIPGFTFYSKIADYIDQLIFAITVLILLSVVYLIMKNKIKNHGR